MIIDITNELLTDITLALDGIAKISTPNGDFEIANFPYVTFHEMSNIDRIDTIDTGGVEHNQLNFEVEIFTKGDTKMSDAKEIRNIVDSVLSPLGLRRNYSDEQPNFLDERIFRYVMRYDCTVDSTKQIYRR